MVHDDAITDLSLSTASWTLRDSSARTRHTCKRQRTDASLIRGRAHSAAHNPQSYAAIFHELAIIIISHDR